MLTSSIASRNELLAELFKVPSITSYLLPEMRIVPLTVNQVLYELGDQIEHIYFPLDSVVSGLAIMEDGTTIETSMIGRDGLVGISTILGSGRSRQWIWVTIGGSAIQLERRFLEKIFVQNEIALKCLTRSYRSLITQLSQRCVCNTRHIMAGLVEWQKQGLTDARILEHHPDLTWADLAAAWDYYATHHEEIERAIKEAAEA